MTKAEDLQLEAQAELLQTASLSAEPLHVTEWKSRGDNLREDEVLLKTRLTLAVCTFLGGLSVFHPLFMLLFLYFMFTELTKE